MTHFKTLTVAAALMAGTALSAQAQELHFIMCGGEVRPADQVVIDTFQADNPLSLIHISEPTSRS